MASVSRPHALLRSAVATAVLGASLVVGVGSSQAATLPSAPAADEINGVVWLDVDADGVNDTSESGFTGARVRLLDAGGAVVGTQTTTASGVYSFTGLPGAFAAPFRVEVSPATAAWPDPSNWVVSSAPHPAYVGTDQDFAAQSDARFGVATGVNPGSSRDAAMRPRPELALGFFGPGVIDGGGDYNAQGNCVDTSPGTIELGEPGDDCGPSNDQVRTQDVVTTVWSITADNFEPGTADWGQVVFEQTLVPETGNAAAVSFERIPLSCVAPPSGSGGSGSPSSAILTDYPTVGQTTLRCNLGQFTEGGQKSLTTSIKVSGLSPNGSRFSTTEKVYVPGQRAVPADGPPVGPIVVSARPAYDLAKLSFRNADTIQRCVDTDNDAGTPCETLRGYDTYFLMRISAAQKTGIESLQQPIHIEDNLTALTAGGAPYTPEFYVTDCVANPSGWGDTVLGKVYGYTQAAYPLYYPRTVPDSGNCAFTREDPADNTSQYDFSLSGADMSGNRYPTATWGGTDLSAGPYIAIEHRVQVFLPFRTIDLADGTLDQQGGIQLFNAVGGFDPMGISGISNYGTGTEPGYCSADFATCDLMPNGTVSNNRIGPAAYNVTTTGSFAKYLSYRSDANGLSYATLPGEAWLRDGAGLSEPGDYQHSFIDVFNSGANPLVNPGVCDVFDNTMMRLATASNVGATAVGGHAWVAPYNWVSGLYPDTAFRNRWRVEYGAVPIAGDDPLYRTASVGQPDIVDSTFYPGTDTYSAVTGRFEGAWDAQRAARCSDSDAPAGWHADPADVPGGLGAINAVRVVPATPGGVLEPGERIRFQVPFEVLSEFNGGPHDGEDIPAGTVFANFGNARTDNYSFGAGLGNWSPPVFQPSPYIYAADGDRSTIARFSTRLQKRTTQPDTLVGQNGATLAGNQIVWELIAAVTAQVTPSSTIARNVKVVDVLPPFTSYNAACTAALGNTALPSLVEPNTGAAGPQAGYTRLTYFIGDVPANDPVDRIRICTDTDPLAPNGTSVENSAVLTADADITTAAQRSDIHAIVLEQNGSMQIGKSVDRRLDPLDDTQVYSVEYANFASAFPLDPPTMIDVLPWNGDGLGGVNERTPESDFEGTVTLTGPPSVTFKDGSVPGSGDPFPQIGTFTYTSDAPSTVNYDPDNNTSTWCLESAFGTAGCPANFAAVTAFRFVSNYALDLDGRPRQGHKFSFTLDADANAASNRYTNRATVDTASLPASQYLRSNNVTVEVAGFNLGDLVFGDVNRNGRYDAAADIAAPAGVTVEVYRVGSSTPVKTVTTNAAGRYLATDLGAGDYYAVIPASEFATGGPLEDWRLQPLGLEADPNTDLNETGDHHGAGVTPGTEVDGVRTAAVTLSATVPASPLLAPTGDEPLGDNVGGLVVTQGDDFTNLTLDIGLIPPARPEVRLTKRTNGADANSAPGPYIAVGDTVTWTYEIANTGTTELVDVAVVDDNGTPSNSADDLTASHVSGDADGDDILDITETWVFRATGTAVEGQYTNTAVVTADPSDRTGSPLPGFDDVDDDDPSHYFGATTGIVVAKRVQSTFDADTAATGPLVGVGDDVRWAFTVRNTGNTTLTDVTVTDDQLGEIVTCRRASLDPGSSYTCFASGVATAGAYVNTATATGTPVDDQDAVIPALADPSDTDVAHHFGAAPAVDIEKLVQTTFDADVATGPLVGEGSDVGFTYVVTNTGNVDLSAIEVEDDIEGTVTCPAATLAVGASMICELFASADAAGQYTNTGTVTATGPDTVDDAGDPVDGRVVTDADDANYFTSVPGIDIEKFVQTTFGADTVGAGPDIADGTPSRFTYVVTNTGNVALSSIAVQDDVVGSITCPQTALAVGDQMTCSTDEVAVSGIYTNVGTVTANGPTTTSNGGGSVPGAEVSDSDTASYFGVTPGVDIEKSVQTTFDADTPSAAPAVASGGAVRWTFRVRNAGNVALTNVTVTDDQLVDDTVIDCGEGSDNVIAALAVGETLECNATGVAIASGTYINIGSVTGTGPDTIDVDGEPVAGAQPSDTDPAYYIVSPPQVDIETSVQRLFDADTAGEAALVPPGGDVLITYTVTNPGVVPIGDVEVSDSGLGTPVFQSGDTDSDGLLDSDETWVYTVTVTAPDEGSVNATGTVMGSGPSTVGADGSSVDGAEVTDADDHHYTASVPAIDVETTVQTTFDADDPNGPMVAPGGDVLVTYTVTNPGPVALSDVAVDDDAFGPATFVSGDTDSDGLLDPDETWIFATTVPAPGSGVETATGTATGTGLPATDSNGDPVPATRVEAKDDHSFEVAVPVIDVETTVQTDFDADTAAAGPLVAPGGDVLITYTVTNQGNTGIENVVVSDDVHGTPTFVSGDIDEDGVLDVDETWIYTSTVTAPESGTVTATGTVDGHGVDTVGTDGAPVAGAPVTANDSHSFTVPAPQVDIETFVQTTFDADDPELGPRVASSGEVLIRFVVTNAGDAPLTDVVVIDDVLGQITCPKATLAVGESMICELTVDAVVGEFVSTGSVTASGPDTVDAAGDPVSGADVDDDDLSHYFGEEPLISVVTKVDGFDANDPTGLLSDPGTTLAYTYEVTNTGNVPLSDVTVVDDAGIVVTCPKDALAIGETMICTGTGPAPAAGQLTNTGTATGTGTATIGTDGGDVDGETVEDEDPANVFVPIASIEVKKYVVVDGVEYDANEGAERPKLPAGSTATWRIKVRNTGNVDLVDVDVIDELAAVTCLRGGTRIDLIEVDSTVTCSATSKVPDSGVVTNTASATGRPDVSPLDGQRSIDLPVSVEAADVAAAAVTARTPGTLAFTGGSIALVVAIGAGLAAAGALLNRRVRRVRP